MRLGVRKVLLQVLPILLICAWILAQNIYNTYTQEQKYREAGLKSTQTISENIYIDAQGNAQVEKTDTIHFGNNPPSTPLSSIFDIDAYQNPLRVNLLEASLTCDGVLVASKPQGASPQPTSNTSPESPTQDTLSHNLPTDLTNLTCEEKTTRFIEGKWDYNTFLPYKDFTVFEYSLPVTQVGTDVTTQSIDMSVHLPVPESEAILLGENTAVIPDWPLVQQGEMQHEVAVDGDTIHIHITHLERTGNYDPDIRVVYPSTWDNLNPHGYYETDQYHINRHFPYRSFALEHITGITLTIFAIALIINLFFLIRYKKKYRPDFKEKYWHDVPDPDLHPVIVSRLWGWNTKAQQEKDFPVLIMNLAHLGAITLIEEKDARGTTEYVIEKQKGETKSLTPLDKQVIQLLFENGEERITFPELKKKLAKRNRNQQIKAKISRIKRTIDKETDNLGTFTTYTMNGLWRYLCVLVAVSFTLSYLTTAIVKTFHLYDVENAIYSLPDLLYVLFGIPHQTILLIIVAFTAFALRDRLFVPEGIIERFGFWALAVISWIASLILESLELDKPEWCINTDYAVLIAEVATITFFLFGVFTLRPPNRVKEVIAKSKALKRWLEDFTLLDEKPPTAVEVWDEFMVYATAFDVADTTLASINNTLPSVASNSQFVSVVSWVKKDADNTSPFEKIGEFSADSTTARR